MAANLSPAHLLSATADALHLPKISRPGTSQAGTSIDPATAPVPAPVPASDPDALPPPSAPAASNAPPVDITENMYSADAISSSQTVSVTPPSTGLLGKLNPLNLLSGTASAIPDVPSAGISITASTTGSNILNPSQLISAGTGVVQSVTGLNVLNPPQTLPGADISISNALDPSQLVSSATNALQIPHISVDLNPSQSVSNIKSSFHLPNLSGSSTTTGNGGLHLPNITASVEDSNPSHLISNITGALHLPSQPNVEDLNPSHLISNITGALHLPSLPNQPSSGASGLHLPTISGELNPCHIISSVTGALHLPNVPTANFNPSQLLSGAAGALHLPNIPDPSALTSKLHLPNDLQPSHLLSGAAGALHLPQFPHIPDPSALTGKLHLPNDLQPSHLLSEAANALHLPQLPNLNPLLAGGHALHLPNVPADLNPSHLLSEAAGALHLPHLPDDLKPSHLVDTVLHPHIPDNLKPSHLLSSVAGALHLPELPSPHDLPSISECVGTAADIVHLAKRAPPTAPTGFYDYEVRFDGQNSADAHSKLTNLVNKVDAFVAKGGFKPDPTRLKAVWDLIKHPEGINDRLGTLSYGLEVLAKIDPHSKLSEDLGDAVIGVLYNTIPHPPASYLGAEHSFRKADGSGNNLHQPEIGQAGRPYSRSVQGTAGLPRSSLPDPGLIFDTILKRHREKVHPAGSSSLVFAYASIVTHSLFRTDPKNMFINNASSYLDLSPLYGDNQEAQDKIRDKEQGRGLLYPDTFSENRLLFVPPAASVLLVLYSRNHNYIAERILKINERGRWANPPPTDPILRAQQDEEIFQTARLINGGHFIQSIIGDYVSGFLGSSEGCNWDMKPFHRIENKLNNVPRGQGNHCSVEFNVLYRWHPVISAKDEKWTEELFSKAFDGKDPATLTLKDFSRVVDIVNAVPSDPKVRNIGPLQRGSDGRFADEDLFNILADATESPASSFGGQNSPGVLRIVEMLGIEQSRLWGVCTMNEFRKFVGLKQFDSFEEWNPDPAIASAARRLYGHIDNLELYTGLVAEEIMPLMDGTRFSCGYTTTRAVLGDAIGLVRGDRFYTTDFTPENLTTWGYYDCQRDMNNGSHGAMIPKLLLRHLPQQYTWNSVYSLWPFFTPEHMKTSLKRQGIDKKYTFERPELQLPPVMLTTFTAISKVFNDSQSFINIYPKFGYGSALNFDDPKQHDPDRALCLKAVFPDKSSVAQLSSWMAQTAQDHLKAKAWTYPGVPGTYVDIVNDVINPTAVQWVCDKFLGIPIKTKENPHALFTYNELYIMLSTLFSANPLLKDDPVNAFAVNDSSVKFGAILAGYGIKSLIEVHPFASPGLIKGLVAKAASLIWHVPEKPWHPYLKTMAETGRPIDQLIGLTLGLVVGSSVNMAQAAVNVIDFYLDDARAAERSAIINLAKSGDQKSTEMIQGYVREAMRLSPQFTGLWRKATVDALVEQGPGLPPAAIKKNQTIWASFRKAHLDPNDFPNPTGVDPNRPISSYHLNGTGFHDCIGVMFSYVTIAEFVKIVFKLPGVRRAPGPAGQMKKVNDVINETDTDFYIQRNGTLSRWPGSLQLMYDA